MTYILPSALGDLLSLAFKIAIYRGPHCDGELLAIAERIRYREIVG